MRSTASRRAGDVNVPALVSLVLAGLALLPALCLPVIGSCVSIPLAALAVLLALIGFATARKDDSGVGLAIAATGASVLSVVASIGWFVFLHWQTERELAREAAEAEAVHAMNETVEFDHTTWKVVDAVATPSEDPGSHRLAIRIEVGNDWTDALPIDAKHLELTGADGLRLEPAGPVGATVAAGKRTEIEVRFPIPKTASDLVLVVHGPIDSARTRRIRIEPREAAPPPPLETGDPDREG